MFSVIQQNICFQFPSEIPLSSISTTMYYSFCFQFNLNSNVLFFLFSVQSQQQCIILFVFSSISTAMYYSFCFQFPSKIRQSSILVGESLRQLALLPPRSSRHRIQVIILLIETFNYLQSFNLKNYLL